ncbi:MAG: non-homologous end-joining DNA ligase [Alphaproteobacteria bacterium]|nr:non-homologous end-joining DNA ligase [Alphaproteobacteria bacterium]
MSAFDVLLAKERERLAPADMPKRPSPMLATLTHDYFSDPDWIYERKLDGERILAFGDADGIRLYTRNHKCVNVAYPEIVDALEHDSDSKHYLIDGEMVAFDGNVMSFSVLQQRMHIQESDKALHSGVRVFYYVFDILYLDGFPLEDLPLRSRKKVLKAAIEFTDPVRYTAHRNEHGEQLLEQACDKGWEGLIAKRAASPYSHSRSRDWLKFKCTRSQELVIGGFTAPRGSRRGFGALLVGYYDNGSFRYAGKVGTGFSEDMLADLCSRFDKLKRDRSPFENIVRENAATWIEPRLVGEFGFTEWTNSGKLRHPRFLGLRRDKEATDVVRETPES